MTETERLVEYYERELSRFGVEAHSGTIQDAAGARLWLSSFHSGSTRDELVEILTVVTQALDSCVLSGRQLMSDLRPLAFCDARLAECAHDLMVDVQRRAPQRAKWSWDGHDPTWAAWRKLGAIRVLWHLLSQARDGGFEQLRLTGQTTSDTCVIDLELHGQHSHLAPFESLLNDRMAPLLTALRALHRINIFNHTDGRCELRVHVMLPSA